MSRIQLERLLKIDELIRKPEQQTAQSLADVLEVSERTVRDDLSFMRDRAHD
ncbi:MULTISPECIES: HTH domain-containing protein [Cyanophyceae]|uniref:HTH domain-containing protein n=1 Tax=Cyanophyceae TaxID=3028117 RepID=UPI001685200E|nr:MULTISPECIES: HTH domain-containing protein [Cyanophyceae]MBD1914282.1 HTH domain-containing protein [Phormidium sp. FACHB-77]MBD2031217.1 HTH domain-containing protein [Phormidium sp. FACHB-322]MBD2049616.1 HTH domain-containing protein [Leptolyngbya sp. FACHB-60]